jgi:hypothetical protein
MLTVAELWKTIRSTHTVLPIFSEIVPARMVDGLPGPRIILPQQHYFAIIVDELFLEHSRRWLSEYDPVVMAITEFVYGGKTVTLPFVVGPKLLNPHATTVPQGMIFRNTRIAGIHPFRGGRVIPTVVLCRSRRLDYALQLVKLVETISTAVPFGAELSTYTKLAESLLDGMDALFGVGETEPLVGLRKEFDYDLGNPIRPTFFALIDAPEKEVPSDRLWVRGGSLYVGDSQDALQPFRSASYVLFSIRGATELSDLDTLPFSGTAKSIIDLAASADEADWKRAKAELLVLYRELLNTPDLTSKQAQVYYDNIVSQAQQVRENAKKIGSLSVSQEASARSSTVQPARAIEEKLRHATSLLDLD